MSYDISFPSRHHSLIIYWPFFLMSCRNFVYVKANGLDWLHVALVASVRKLSKSLSLIRLSLRGFLDFRD